MNKTVFSLKLGEKIRSLTLVIYFKFLGDVSRNVQKAEEALNASKIQSFTKKNSDDSNEGETKSTQSQLFPHLVNAKESPPLKGNPSEALTHSASSNPDPTVVSPPMPTRKLLFEDVVTPNRRKIVLTPVPKSASRYQHPAFAQDNLPAEPVPTSAAAKLSSVQSPDLNSVQAGGSASTLRRDSTENLSEGDSKKSSKRQLFEDEEEVSDLGDLGLLQVIATPEKQNSSQAGGKAPPAVIETVPQAESVSDFEVEKRNPPGRLSRSKVRHEKHSSDPQKIEPPAHQPARLPAALTKRVSVSLRRTPSIDLVARLTPNKHPEPIEGKPQECDDTSPDARRRRSRCKTRLVDGVFPEDREEDLDGCSGDASPILSPAAASDNITTKSPNVTRRRTKCEQRQVKGNDEDCSPSFIPKPSADKTTDVTAQTPRSDNTFSVTTPPTVDSDDHSQPPRRRRDAGGKKEEFSDTEVSPVRKRMTASIKKRRSRLSRLESNRGDLGKASDEEDEEVVISKKQLDYDLEIVIEASKLSSQSEAVCKQPGDTTTSEAKSVQEASGDSESGPFISSRPGPIKGPTRRKRSVQEEKESYNDEPSADQDVEAAAAEKCVKKLSLKHDLKPLKVKVDRSLAESALRDKSGEGANVFQTPAKKSHDVEEETTPSRPSRLKRVTNR